MKKTLFAFALLITATGSFAQASEMKRACIDNSNGTYIASEDDSLVCANGGCKLPNGTNLSGLYEEGTLSRVEKSGDVAAQKTLNNLAMNIRPALGNSKNSNPSSEPKLYFAAKNIAIFCTSDIDADDFSESHIAENLSEIK
ncbi:MAG: hypothetical protein EOP05_11850 [Proteobacteria bacterium]|nr:MAG: hypothetical protein EOP05_11850 [Pseudomonadota bacterium]